MTMSCMTTWPTWRLRVTISSRSTAAMLIDWFRFCIRQGYLPPTSPSPARSKSATSAPRRALDKQMRLRRAEGLNLPYGPAAERRKLTCEGLWAPDPPDPPF